MVAEIATGIVALGTLGLVASLLLARASARYPRDDESVASAVNRLLPQTQCAQCGYPGCRPYAEAIANGEAINRCPPGGEQTIADLANLLGRPLMPLDETCGVTAPPMTARIREAECIGCTLCIQACPVDAILGAGQLMHTVIESECTGCELCLPPCPVDCIDLVPLQDSLPKVDAARFEPTFECIRCGDCEGACPRGLSPENLYWWRGDDAMLEAFELDRCIECRLCDRACPSSLPLTALFADAKSRVAARREREAMAHSAQWRYERHIARTSDEKHRVRTRPSGAEAASLLDIIARQNDS